MKIQYDLIDLSLDAVLLSIVVVGILYYKGRKIGKQNGVTKEEIEIFNLRAQVLELKEPKKEAARFVGSTGVGSMER